MVRTSSEAVTLKEGGKERGVFVEISKIRLGVRSNQSRQM